MVTRKLISLLTVFVFLSTAVTPLHALAPQSANRKFQNLSEITELLSIEKDIGQSLRAELARVQGEIDRAVQDGRFFAVADLDQMNLARELLAEDELPEALVELFVNNVPGAGAAIRRNLRARLEDERFRTELSAVLLGYWVIAHRVVPRIDRPFAIVIEREGHWGSFFARDAGGNILRDKDNKPIDLLSFAGCMQAPWATQDAVYTDFQLALFAQRDGVYFSALEAMFKEQTDRSSKSLMDDDPRPSIQAFISDFLSFQPRPDFVSQDARSIPLPECLQLSDSLPSLPNLTPRQQELEGIFRQRGYVSVLEIPLKRGFWEKLMRRASSVERNYSLITQTIHGWDREPANAEDHAFYSQWLDFEEGPDMSREETRQAQMELERFLQSRGMAFKPCAPVKGLGRKLQALLALLQAIPMEYFNAGLLKTIDLSDFDTYSKGTEDGEYHHERKALFVQRSQIDNALTATFIALAAHELTHWLYATLSKQALRQEEIYFFENDMLFLRQADAMLLLDIRESRLQLKGYLDRKPIGEWIAETGMAYLAFPDTLRRHIQQYAPGTPQRDAWDRVYDFYKNRMFGGREFSVFDAARLSDSLNIRELDRIGNSL